MAQITSVANDAERHVALRLAALFRRGRYRIESDVGEENNRRAREHARKTVRRERMPVGGIDSARRAETEKQNRDRS